MKRSRRLLSSMPIAVALVLSSCGGDGESAGGAGGADRVFATLELDATAPVSFSYLNGVRELSDGSILAADPTSQVLLRIDMDAGAVDTIGRQGAGPHEYDGPDRVFPLPGDSTLLVDLGNGRLTVIDPQGTFVSWIPMTTSAEGGEARTINPSFVDAGGWLYTTAPRYLPGPADSLAVHRIDRTSLEETPVAWTWRTDYVRRPPGSKRPMLVPRDDWAVGSDGRLAVVRANGYSVDWYLPDGSVVQGQPNEVERFPVGMPEMEAELEYMITNYIFTQVMFGEGGTQSFRMARGIPRGMFSGIDAMEWPETLPVFRIERTLVSPQGEAWVERMMPAGAPGRVEVFNDRGIFVGFIELPPSAKVVGFGGGGEPASAAYVARTDDVGLVWLERYRLPRIASRD